MLLTQPVSELTTHVFLPVIEETAHRILRTLNLTEVIQDQIFIETGFTASSRTSNIEQNAILGPQAFRVEASLQMNPSSQKFDFYTFHHTAAYGINRNTLRDPYPIYYDRENHVKIVEMRSPVSIMMNCELTLVSKELSYSVPQQIFNAYENGAVYELNDFAYDYPVPPAILSVLYGMWQMDRRKGKKAGVMFLDYLQRNTQHGWQRRKHRDPCKDQYEIVIPVYDLQTLAVLEYSDDKPQSQLEGKLPIGFQIPFVYTIQFALPTLNIMEYHPVYNNQPLPMRMIPEGTAQRFNNIEESRRGIDLQRYYERPKTGISVWNRAIRSPEYDDWAVPAHAPAFRYSQQPFFISCVTLDENECLITDLDYSQDFDPSFRIKDWVKELLYQQGPCSVEPSAILSVQVYRNNKPLLPYKDFQFTEDLHVRFKGRNLHDQYRVVFSECHCLNKIDIKWYPLLKRFYPFLCSPIKNQIRRNIENHGEWCDPKWLKQCRRGSTITLSPLGWVMDTSVHPIIHISDSTYPRITRTRRDTYWKESVRYADLTENRITRYNIVARTAKER